MFDYWQLKQFTSGVLMLIAVGYVTWAHISVNGVAQPILRQARIELFNDPEERGDQILVPHPNLRRWEHHYRFPDYYVIWRREHWRAWRQMMKPLGLVLFAMLVAAL